jgi:TolB protein
MIAFDPQKAKAGQDPSLGSFWFPYQDINSGNHIAQWVSKLERQPCTEDSECKSGEECIDGSCYAVIK